MYKIDNITKLSDITTIHHINKRKKPKKSAKAKAKTKVNKLTLADIKRYADKGILDVELIEYYGKTGEDIPSRLRGVWKAIGTTGKGKALVVKIQSSTGNVNEIRFTRTDFIECDGRTLVIYGSYKRHPNAQEKALLNEWQKIEETHIRDNPYADIHQMKEEFFASSAYPYMSGIESGSGSEWRYDGEYVYNSNTRGEAEAVYKLNCTISENGVCDLGYALCFVIEAAPQYYSGDTTMFRGEIYAIYSDTEIKRYTSPKNAEVAYRMLQKSCVNMPTECDIVELSDGATVGNTIKRVTLSAE